MTREIQLTFDCADPDALARFWCEVLGYERAAPPPGFATWDEALDAFGVPAERRNDASAAVDPQGSGPRLFFQRVPEGKTAKNRVHLDVRAAPGLTGADRMAALEAECERLVTVGAERLERHEPAPGDEPGVSRDGRPRGQRVLPRLITSGVRAGRPATSPDPSGIRPGRTGPGS